jgi:cytochrome c553
MSLLAAAFALLAAQDAPAVLEASCVRCHDAAKKKGGLDLSTREALLRGGDSGPAVAPGKAEASLLVKVVAHQAEPHMPHRAPRLGAEAAGAIAAWIDAGAPYGRTLRSSAVEETHWAFRPLRKPAAPLEKLLGTRGPEAGPLALLRRASFGLTGLPPTPGDVEDLLKDGDWGRVVDRLLAGPHYGERWGRHWLDLARYADSSGYESDYDRRTAYLYRDFVIRALNEDLPYDTFVRWQVAGDEIDPGNPQALAATGFCTVGPFQKTLPTDTPRNKEIYRNDAIDDVIGTAAGAFLGLTLGCARCHDHKYDPIPQRDYYRLSAVFLPSERKERSLSLPRRRLEEWLEAKRAAFRDARIDALPLAAEEKDLLRNPEDGNIVSSKRLHKEHGARLRFTDEEWMSPADRDERERLEREAGADAPPRALALWQPPGGTPKTWLLGRGDPDAKLEVVEPGFLSAITRDPGPFFDRAAGRRTAFADWLVDVDRGAGALLARVVVNRLWQHHFGEGLVRTPSDFGIQGERPTDPELLDALAAELVARKWSLKAIHRILLRSPAYRSARAKPIRLEAEALRDALLSASGRLDRSLYGPAVKAPIPKEAIVTRTKDPYPADLRDGPAVWRRSVYLFVKRSVMNPMMETFDAPAASAGCGRRVSTTVAPQALYLLNDPFVRGCARDLAKRSGGNLERAWLLALGRPPREAERAAAERFLGDSSFEDLCHVLFTLNEFAYVD